MRLTEKIINGLYEVNRDYSKFTKQGYDNDKEDCIDKLGQLEDIEEELGIDLVTLFKAIREGKIYSKGPNCYPRFYAYNEICNIDFHEKKIRYKYEYPNNFIRDGVHDYTYMEVKFNEYGKTWALTKEELE